MTTVDQLPQATLLVGILAWGWREGSIAHGNHMTVAHRWFTTSERVAVVRMGNWSAVVRADDGGNYVIPVGFLEARQVEVVSE